MHLIQKYKYLLLLGVIVLIGFLLRWIQVSVLPPSLNWDEISHGYNAYSILTHGVDEWGNYYPSIFRAYGDYKLPVYIYTTVVSIALFGLNVFAVRLPSVVGGAFTILGTYLLVNELLRSKKHSLFAAAIIAISPWNIFLSRAALEANLALTLIVFGFYFVLLARTKPSYLIAGLLCLGLSIWTYNSARIFVPPLIMATFILYCREYLLIVNNYRKIALLASLIGAVLFTPMVYQLLQPAGQARYENLVIIDEGAIAYLEEQRNTSSLSPLFTKLVYNKPVYFVSTFAKQYSSHFLPDFLFLSGGDNYQFSVPNQGLFYFIDTPLFYLGIGLSLLWVRKKKEYVFICLWALLAPIAASITREAPHVLRAEILNPIPAVFISVAGIWLYERVKVKRQVVVCFYTVIVLISLGSWLKSYYAYRTNYSWAWQYGYKEMVAEVKAQYSQYKKIVITKKYGEAHEFVLFYWPWDSMAYQSDPNLIRFYQSNWYWIDRFDKFYFVNDWQIPRRQEAAWILESGDEFVPDNDTLLVTSPGNYPYGWEKISTIYFLDGTPAFELLTIHDEES